MSSSLSRHSSSSSGAAGAALTGALILFMVAVTAYLIIVVNRWRKSMHRLLNSDQAARLDALAELRAAGLITELEFQAKGAEIRSGM